MIAGQFTDLYGRVEKEGKLGGKLGGFGFIVFVFS